MKFLRTICAFAIAMLCGVGAMAQSQSNNSGYEPYPYNFVQLQGGVGTTLTNVTFTDLISPTASIGIGRFVSPVLGGRLHVNAWESKGGFKSIPDTYKFNYVNTNADLLLNLNNLISKNNTSKFNVILVGGLGLNYAWGNDDLISIITTKNPTEPTHNAWGESRRREQLLSHNIRAGLLFDLNLAKSFNLGLEIDANSLSDDFNSKYTNADDWMITAQLALTFKFGHKKAKVVTPAPVVVPVQKPVEQPVEKKVEPAPVQRPVVVEKPKEVAPETMQLNVFFNINVYDQLTDEDMAHVKEYAEWIKNHPGVTATVTGYADKGTGTAQINERLSKQRANFVADLLKKEGVKKEQIKVEWKGDTVQPFSENDKNRCVISIAAK